MSSALAGSAPLLRTLLRHDLRRFAPWIAIATLLSASTVLVYPWLFPGDADRAALATAIGANPALGIIFGPAFDLTTADGFNAWRSMAIAGFLTSLGAIFAVTQSTRGQEDTGQAELLASGVLGRSSRLLAGVGLALIGSLVVGAVAGAVTGLCGGNWNSSLLLAATFTCSGWIFTGIAAIAAQLGSDARTANTLAVSALGILFLLRGFAYAMSAPEWTVWANPLGWMTETRPASGDRWWPLAFTVAFAAVALTIAFALQSRRDFGQGAIAPKPGPSRGAVRTPWALALRLGRGSLISWAIAFAVFGLVFGSFATAIHELLGKDSAIAAFLASGATTSAELTSAFLVTIYSMVGMLAAVPGVQFVLRVHGEETADRLGIVLAGAVSRSRYFAANLALAFIAPAVFAMLAGTGIALMAASANLGVGLDTMLLQALVTVPAVWAAMSIAIAVVGVRPRVVIAAWAGVLVSFVLTMLGPTFKFPDWVISISPFKQVPNMGEASPNLIGLVWIGIAVVFFTIVGITAFRRRDVEG